MKVHWYPGTVTLPFHHDREIYQQLDLVSTMSNIVYILVTQMDKDVQAKYQESGPT